MIARGRRRLDARRRHRLDDQPARRRRLLQHRRDDDAQRRARARVAPVRPPPRRLRARRRRGRAACSSGSTMRAARGAHDPRRDRGLRHSFDAHGISEPHPEGRGALPGDVAARSTTPASTRRASTASTRTAPRRRRTIPSRRWRSSACSASARGEVPVCATKSMIGHLISAAGAVEAIAAIVVHEGGLGPSDDQPRRARPGVRSRLRAARRARSTAQRYVLSNSFGFGGQNAAIVLQAADA